MLPDFHKYLLIASTAFVVSLALTPLLRNAARRLGIVDVPDERRIHRQPIPLGGGLAIFVSLHLCFLVAHLAGWTRFSQSITPAWWLGFLAGSTCIAAVGLLDDIFGLRPWIKLTGQIAAALLVLRVSGGMGALLWFDLAAYPLLGKLVGLFWLLAIMNAFNLIDGMDGLAAGLAAIAATGMAGMLIFLRAPTDALFFLALAAAALGFLRYNFSPASVFLGDTGSLFLGYALAAMSLQASAKGTLFATLGVPLLAMGVPVFDTILAIWRRSMRKIAARLQDTAPAKSGIMVADKEHLHHRMLLLGLTQHRAALILYAASGLLALLGIAGAMLRTRAAGLYLMTFLVAAYIVMRHLVRAEIWETGRLLTAGLQRPLRRAAVYVFYVTWDLAMLVVCFTLASWLHAEGLIGIDNWLTQLPLWMTPMFFCLAFSGQYNRVWSQARFSDYFAFNLALCFGILTSMGLVGILRGELDLACLRFALLFLSLTYTATLGARLTFRSLCEFMGYAANRDALHRVLIYGAGRRADLLIRELYWQHRQTSDDGSPEAQRAIVGIVDDDPNLRGRRSYGFRVLGNGDALPELIREYDIKTLIVTANLPPERKRQLHEIANSMGINLREWTCTESKLQ